MTTDKPSIVVDGMYGMTSWMTTTWAEWYLKGYYLGDGSARQKGHRTSRMIRLCGNRKDAPRVKETLERLGAVFNPKPSTKKSPGTWCHYVPVRDHWIFDGIDLTKRSKTKTLDPQILDTHEKIRAIISGMWDSDGTVWEGSYMRVSYSTSSQGLSVPLEFLLRKYGMEPHVSVYQRRGGTPEHTILLHFCDYPKFRALVCLQDQEQALLDKWCKL